MLSQKFKEMGDITIKLKRERTEDFNLAKENILELVNDICGQLLRAGCSKYLI